MGLKRNWVRKRDRERNDRVRSGDDRHKDDGARDDKIKVIEIGRDNGWR